MGIEEQGSVWQAFERTPDRGSKKCWCMLNLLALFELTSWLAQHNFAVEQCHLKARTKGEY